MSQSMRVLVGVVAVWLSACERPTAVQVRDAVETGAQKLLAEDSASGGNGHSAHIWAAAMYSTNTLAPVDTVSGTRDGRGFQLRASVMEFIYLPPCGNPAQPILKRMAIGWSGDPKGDPDHARVLMMLSNDTIPRIEDPTYVKEPEDSPKRRYGHLSMAMNVEPGDPYLWSGRSGSLTISEGVPAGPCPYSASAIATSPIPLLAEEHRAEQHGSLVCETRRYLVDLSTVLARVEAHADPAQWQTTTLHLRAQIRGVRFVTQCSGVRNDDPSVCWPFTPNRQD